MKSQYQRGQYPLSKDEVINIINSTDNFRDRCIIKSLYYGGMRVNECVTLQKDRIDLNRKIISILGKGDKFRTIPFLESGYYADIKHYLTLVKDNILFPMSTRNVQKMLIKYSERAGIKNPCPFATHVNPHIFRHSIARHLKDDNYPLEFIRNFMGHESIKTTMDVYGNITIHDMQKLIFRKTNDTQLVPRVEGNVPEVIDYSTRT